MTVVLVVVLAAVVAGAGVTADRTLAQLAETKASAFLTTPLGDAARVQVHGRPFLTQAIRGRYGRVEVTAPEVNLGALGRSTLHAHLVNAYLPLRDLLGRRANELPVEHVYGHVVIPYAQLARIGPVPGLAFRYRDERLIATAALPLPGFSQLVRISGEAVTTVGETGGVWLRVRDLQVAGLTVPSIVLNQIIPSLAFPIPLPRLPWGLRIDGLTPTAEGLQVSGSAGAVVFRPGGDLVQ
jgi:hypothetical protein